MAEYTIVAAEHKKDMPPKDGMRPSQVVVLSLQDLSGAQSHSAEWITSKDTDVAALVGARVNGTLKRSQWGLNFRKDSQNAGPGGRGRDPKDTAAMSRSAAQDRALAYMQVKATMGVLKEDFKPDALLPLMDWFQADVKRFQDRDEPKTVHGLPVRNEPQRTGAPEPTTPTADYEPTPADGSEPFAA